MSQDKYGKVVKHHKEYIGVPSGGGKTYITTHFPLMKGRYSLLNLDADEFVEFDYVKAGAEKPDNASVLLTEWAFRTNAHGFKRFCQDKDLPVKVFIYGHFLPNVGIRTFLSERQILNLEHRIPRYLSLGDWFTYLANYSDDDRTLEDFILEKLQPGEGRPLPLYRAARLDGVSITIQIIRIVSVILASGTKNVDEELLNALVDFEGTREYTTMYHLITKKYFSKGL